MKQGRVVRKKVGQGAPPAQAASVTQLPTFSPELSGRRLDLQILEPLPDGRKFVQAFLDWQVGKRGAYSVGINVRRYMVHALAATGKFDKDSLQSYRAKLEADEGLADGTRRSYYANAVAYIAFLAKRGLIRDETLPTGFRGIRTTPKATFSESVQKWEIIRGTTEFKQWVESVAKVPTLDRTGREVLAISQGWMGLLEDYAAGTVRRQIDDWVFADQAIQALEQGSGGEWLTQRSIATAIAHLYATFGYILPRSRDWPPGIADYCKHRGWGPDRVRASLFATPKSLDAFLVLVLSNTELAPNVDSVLFYAFVGCLTPTDEASKARISLGKFRGAGATASMERRSPLVVGLEQLERIVSRAVTPNFAEYKHLTRDGGLPLFLHASTKGGGIRVKTLDPSMAAYMVRRFISRAALAHPVLAPLVSTVTGENFRTTHLLIRNLRGESLFTIQQIARHSDPDTTAGYLDRIEVEASSRIRHSDYQKYLVTEARSRRAKRLGNGFHCESSNARQEACVRLDACGAGPDGCPARRIVLESPKIVAEWIGWERHIEARAEYLKEHRPERWANIWQPRLLEYRILLESTSSNMKHEAEKYVANVSLLPLE